MTVYLRVWLRGQDAETINRFTYAIRQLPQVVECHLTAGDGDFLLWAASADDHHQFQIGP